MSVPSSTESPSARAEAAREVLARATQTQGLRAQVIRDLMARATEDARVHATRLPESARLQESAPPPESTPLPEATPVAASDAFALVAPATARRWGQPPVLTPTPASTPTPTRPRHEHSETTIDLHGNAARVVRQTLEATTRRANEAVTEPRVRDTLVFLGFDEIATGYFVRPDGVYGRAQDTDDARIFTTIKVGDVVGSAATFVRIVRRFARVHGPLVR